MPKSPKQKICPACERVLPTERQLALHRARQARYLQRMKTRQSRPEAGT